MVIDLSPIPEAIRDGFAYDNALCESFFATLQRELLDTKTWTTRHELGSAIFEYIEA